MRLLGLLFAAAIAVVSGVALGTVPIVKENLHWNVWVVIPVSGLLFGVGMGWLQFQIARLSGARVGWAAGMLLALAAAAGYVGTDFGAWWTQKVQLEPEGEFAGGEFALHELMPFPDYMALRLESSSVEMRHGRAEFAMGATGATLSFAADVAGTWLGALGMLLASGWGAPYCRRCKQYKKSVARTETPLDHETANENVATLQETIESGDYAAVVAFLNELAKEPAPPEELVLKLSTDERVCGGCNEATLLCRVMRLSGTDWEEALRLEAHSASGDTARTAPRA